MGRLFGGVRGGIAISTVLVRLTTCRINGCSGCCFEVVSNGTYLSAWPALEYSYDKGLACGTICASGTLGQIIPPSITS
ncbi:TRAP transporter large permease subunit [Vibrio lentus]|nr:TRAP transporter large permease subunit [Vibrio lentus]